MDDPRSQIFPLSSDSTEQGTQGGEGEPLKLDQGGPEQDHQGDRLQEVWAEQARPVSRQVDEKKEGGTSKDQGLEEIWPKRTEPFGNEIDEEASEPVFQKSGMRNICRSHIGSAGTGTKLDRFDQITYNKIHQNCFWSFFEIYLLTVLGLHDHSSKHMGQGPTRPGYINCIPLRLNKGESERREKTK